MSAEYPHNPGGQPTPVPRDWRRPLSDEELDDLTGELAELVYEKLPRGLGFMLLIYEHAPGWGSCFVTDGERGQVEAALRGMLGRWERERGG